MIVNRSIYVSTLIYDLKNAQHYRISTVRIDRPVYPTGGHKMPRSRTSWYGVSNKVNGVLTGFVATIPVNLLSSWFQQDIIPNKFLTLSVIILLAALCYLLVKVHAPRFLIAASFGFVAGMYVNIFSWLIQFDVLNNSFTAVNVVLIVFITVLVYVSGTFIGSHPVRKGKTWLRNKSKAKNSKFRLASKGKAMKKPQTPKKRIRRGFW